MPRPGGSIFRKIDIFEAGIRSAMPFTHPQGGEEKRHSQPILSMNWVYILAFSNRTGDLRMRGEQFFCP